MKDKTNYLYPQLLRVLALMRLNRHIPVGTHGDVRGRLFKENRLLVYRKNAKSATIKPIGNTMIFSGYEWQG